MQIEPEHLKIVQDVLKQHIPGYEVRAFGSRVSGDARKFSDLDLAVVGNEKLSLAKKMQLEEAFELSKLPFRVDVVEWQRIDESFRDIIRKNCEVL